MIEIPNTTLCCVDCTNHELSIAAIKHCFQSCQFNQILFFTDREFRLGEIEVIRIPPIKSIEEYSLFIIKELNNYIETDFVLITQYDGFIVNPDSWTTEFQKYDYIGAKWRYTDGMNVGNGGFSLRSKRLLQAFSSRNIHVDGKSVKNGEDHFICRLARRFLESNYNIQFAPEAIADKFSYEYVNSTEKPFGFHGLFNIWEYIKSEDVDNFVNRLSQKTLTSIHVLKLGIIYHKMGQFHQAKIVYRKILEYWPDNTAVFMLLDMANKGTAPDIPV
jgi:hypothetical protein